MVKILEIVVSKFVDIDLKKYGLEIINFFNIWDESFVFVIFKVLKVWESERKN